MLNPVSLCLLPHRSRCPRLALLAASGLLLLGACTTSGTQATPAAPDRVAVEDTPAPWSPVEASGLGFAAEFPASPALTHHTIPYGLVLTQATKYVATNEETQFEVDVVEYPATVALMLAANPGALLHGAAEGLARNTGGTLQREEQAEVSGQSGLRVETGYPDGKGESLLVFHRARLYRVRVLHRGPTLERSWPTEVAARFFAAFKLLAVPVTEPASAPATEPAPATEAAAP